MVTVCAQPGNGLWFCKLNASKGELRRFVRDYPKAWVEIRNDTEESDEEALNDYPHVA